VAQTSDSTQEATAISGLSMESYASLVSRADRVVLVSFSADWCIICKRQAPILEAIEKQYPKKLALVKIDMELNPKVAEYFEVDGLPVLLLYKDGRLAWNRMGFMRKEEIEEKLHLFDY